MNPFAQLVIVMLLPSALAGCQGERPTAGDLGRVDFAYRFTNAPCSEMSYGLDRPVEAHDAEPVCVVPRAGGEALPALVTLNSSDPGVFDVFPGGLDGGAPGDPQSLLGPGDVETALVVTLRAHARGEARLSVVDSTSGELFDAVTVRVSDAASVELDLDLAPTDGSTNFQRSSGVGGVAVRVGQEAGLYPRVFDSTGVELAAWHGVAATVGDPEVADVSEDESADDDVAQTIAGRRHGSTTLTLRAAGVERRWPVEVR